MQWRCLRVPCVQEQVLQEKWARMAARQEAAAAKARPLAQQEERASCPAAQVQACTAACTIHVSVKFEKVSPLAWPEVITRVPEAMLCCTWLPYA